MLCYSTLFNVFGQYVQHIQAIYNHDNQKNICANTNVYVYIKSVFTRQQPLDNWKVELAVRQWQPGRFYCCHSFVDVSLHHVKSGICGEQYEVIVIQNIAHNAANSW